MTSPEPEPNWAVAHNSGPPVSVRLACGALAAMVVLVLAELAAAVHDALVLDSVVQRVGPGAGASPSEIEQFRSDQGSYTLLYCSVLVVLIAFLTLAALNSWRGRRSGQVLAIIYSIPSMFCFASSFFLGRPTNLQIAFENAEPAWANVIGYATIALSPLAVLVIIALLTRSARQHFSWLPPAPPGYMWAPSAVAWPYQDSQDR